MPPVSGPTVGLGGVVAAFGAAGAGGGSVEPRAVLGGVFGIPGGLGFAGGALRPPEPEDGVAAS